MTAQSVGVSLVWGWLISPLAQGIVFVVFLFRIIDESFPGDLHPRVPMRKAVAIMAAYFSLWHVPNFLAGNASFVWLQPFYTFIVGMLMGLSRQWTGSIFYAVFTHSVGNCIAWWYAPRVAPRPMREILVSVLGV